MTLRVAFAYNGGMRQGASERGTEMDRRIAEAKQDKFLQFAAKDIMTKQGLEEDHAWTIVVNTYCN